MDLLNEALDSTPTPPKQPRTITLPIALLKADFFTQGGVCMLISYQTAYIIAAADSPEDFFHIEFPDKDHNKEKFPKLWLKKDFLESRTRWLKLKLESELYRQKSYVIRENRENLIYRIRKLTGLDRTDDALITMVNTLMEVDTDEIYTLYGCKRIAFDEEKFKEEWMKKHGH